MNSAKWRALVAANIKKRRDEENGVVMPSAVPPPPVAPLFCKDCAYHSAEFDREKGKIKHYCGCPTLLNMVTGEKSHPASNRNSETLCGREARHFLRRPLVIEHQAATPEPEKSPMLPAFVPNSVPR